MKDYERLRKALGQLLHTLRYWNLADRFYLTEVIKEAEKALAETPETSEMERLVEWLTSSLGDVPKGWDDEWGGQACAYENTLDYIHTEFGYGGEDATE